MKILRIDETMARTGYSRTPLYARVLAGHFTRPVKLGRRASGWPEHEVDTLVAACVAGATATELEDLVFQLHTQRLTKLLSLLGKINNADASSAAGTSRDVEVCQ